MLLLAACSGGAPVLLPAPEEPQFPGTPIAVYTRIARGASACWFGPRGRLERTYIWHAKVEPESRGGGAVAGVHERFEDNKPGLKAFSVSIEGKGEATAVTVDNLKMSDSAARAMTSDVYFWARGGVGCNEDKSRWAPAMPEPQRPSVAGRPSPAGR